MNKREPNGQPLDLFEYRRQQTGWTVDSKSRGPRVDLTKLYDFVFDAVDAGLHPIDTLRGTSPRVKIGLIATAGILATGIGANYYVHSPYFEDPDGPKEVDLLGKNVDGLAGVEEARVQMYVRELPGIFSESGQEQLRIAALQSDDPPLFNGGDLEKTQRGLDALITISQIIDGHDLGNGRYLEYDDVAKAQLLAQLGDFVGSGLASEEVEALHEAVIHEDIVAGLQDLPQNLKAARAVLDGREIHELDSPIVGNTLEGPDQGR